MKFGVITLVSDNYGNKYQNYAVEQLMAQYGEVTSYAVAPLYAAPASERKKSSRLTPSYIKSALTARMMYRYDITCVDRGLLRNLLYVQMHKAQLLNLKKLRAERFGEFSRKHLHISETVLDRLNTGDLWREKDFFLCGSDQIWNPNYKTTSELAFCAFAPERTVCIAPSFGVSQIPEHRKEDYARWLGNIRTLSVREAAGQKIIKELTGRDAELLLDPTMALPAAQWEDLAKKPENELPKEYIACYFLGKITKSYRRKIRRLAKEKDLPVVMLFDITSPAYYAYDPAEVLYTIRHARYVLTDSFHGSVFSVLFHKDFSVFLRDEGTVTMNSRLETLLERFSLQDRFGVAGCPEIAPERWERVDAVLETERAHTRQYLENAIRAGAGEHREEKTALPTVYSGYLKNEKTLMQSASGGAATACAEAILQQGGCVFGAAYTEDYKGAEYICCETAEELKKLQGSKYCETKKNFALLAEKLNEGRTVLFIGLGCDVAAAIAYCKSKNAPTEKLYTVDVLCHGPMGAAAHRGFIEDLEKKYHSPVVSFTSRSKEHGWSSSSVMAAKFANGKEFRKPMEATDYGYVFTHYALPRCTNCHFKGGDHQGDLCVGDHWGLTARDSGWNKNGVSILIRQTEKGRELLDMLGERFRMTETDARFALEHNPMYGASRSAQSDLMILPSGLHSTLKARPAYRQWRRKMREMQCKRQLLRLVKR